MSTFVDPIRDGWMGKELSDYLFGGRYPQTSDEWLDFFVHLVKLYDAVHEDNVETINHPTAGEYELVPTTTPVLSKTITPEIRSYIVHRVRADVPSPELRAELKEHFGIDVTATYMSQLRKRVLKNIKGDNGNR